MDVFLNTMKGPFQYLNRQELLGIAFSEGSWVSSKLIEDYKKRATVLEHQRWAIVSTTAVKKKDASSDIEYRRIFDRKTGLRVAAFHNVRYGDWYKPGQPKHAIIATQNANLYHSLATWLKSVDHTIVSVNPATEEQASRFGLNFVEA